MLLKALGIPALVILHHDDHQGLFYSRNQETVLFSVLGVSFYKRRPDLRHHSGLSVLVIILTSGFLW